MIIIGLTDCKDCKYVKDKLRDVKYIELGNRNRSEEISNIKRALLKLKHNGKFPTILSDDLSFIININDVIDMPNNKEDCHNCNEANEEFAKLIGKAKKHN